MRFAIVVSILIAANSAADTEIHRCLLDDGTMAFQETPCPEPADPTDEGSESGESRSASDSFAARNSLDQSESPPTDVGPTTPETVTQDRAECERKTRDAIDAIDIEMRETAYTKERGQEYLSELLALTQQLRACKQL